MFDLSKDEIIKLNLPNKRWFYQKLIIDRMEFVKRAKTICLMGLGHWCYAKWLLEEFSHLEPKNLTIMASANLRFLYRDLEKVYNIIYVEDREYVAKCRELGMKFDLIVMNPPYDGEGDPLYMRITKALYDNCLNDLGKMISINPTGVVDTLYSDAKMKIYSDSLLLEDFDFDDRLRNAFSADIKSGIGIFTYSKYGKHRLDSDWVRSIRFGEKTWQMRKQIIKKVGHFIGNGKGLTDITNFGMSNKNIVIINQHTGSKDLVTGKYKYDWPVLHSNQYLIVQTKLPEKPHFAIGFPVKEDAISFLKWINTDFVMFFVMTYKKHIRNTKTILALIPQSPILDGNYSDEVLMKHFNLTQEEMDWIHFEMKDFGWKVNLKKTESELMAYIDEINK